jgi:hypothetical protein
MNWTMGMKAFVCSSDQIPRHSGVIRPFGRTPVASTITQADPRAAMDPKWTRCQVVGIPVPCQEEKD